MQILSLTDGGTPRKIKNALACRGETAFSRCLFMPGQGKVTFMLGECLCTWDAETDMFRLMRQDKTLLKTSGDSIRTQLSPVSLALLRPATPDTPALIGRLRETHELLQQPSPLPEIREAPPQALLDALGPYGVQDMLARLKAEKERRHQEAVARSKELRLLDSVYASQRFVYFRNCYERSCEKLKTRLQAYIEAGERCLEEYRGFFGWLRRREGPPAYLREFVMKNEPLTSATMEGIRQDCLLCRDILTGLEQIALPQPPPPAQEVEVFLERLDNISLEKAMILLSEADSFTSSTLSVYEAERERRLAFLREYGWLGGTLDPETALRRTFGLPQPAPVKEAETTETLPEWRSLCQEVMEQRLPLIVDMKTWDMEITPEHMEQIARGTCQTILLYS